MHGFGQTALCLNRIGNAERANEGSWSCGLRYAGDQLAQTEERIALALRHEIDTARLAKRDGIHSVNNFTLHLRQVARYEQIAVLAPIWHKFVSDLLAFSLSVNHALGIGRA